MSEMFANLTDDQRDTLRDMVYAWIGEGFTTPPYKAVDYDIFEGLDLDPDSPWLFYDIRRPSEV